MKRWLGILMVCCMLFTMVQPLALADSEGTLTIRDVTVAAGSADTVAVPVTLSENPGLTGLTFNVTYPSVLEIQGVDFGTLFSTKESNASDKGNPVTILLNNTDETKENGTVATINFTLKSDAAAGTYPFDVTVDFAGNDDKDWNLTLEKGNLIVTSATPEPAAKYDVTVTTPTNGSVTPNPDKAAKDETVTLTVAPDTGYELDALTVNGASASIETTKTSDTTYTFAMPGEAVTVAATFKPTSTPPSPSANGALTISDVTVAAGSADTLAVPVTLSGNPGLTGLTFNVTYPSVLEIQGVDFGTLFSTKESNASDKGNPVTILLNNTDETKENGTVATINFTLKSDASAGTYPFDITVDFAGNDDNDWNLTLEKGNLIVTPGNTEYDIEYVTPQNGKISGAAKAAADTTVTVTVEPDAGYKLDKLTVNGAEISGTTFKMPAEKAKVEATFVVDGGGTPATEYDIEYVTPQNGKISGAPKAAADTTVTVTVEPDAGYKLDKLTVNGAEISGTTFKMPAEKAKVEATFVVATPVTEYDIEYVTPQNGKISGAAKAAADTTVTVTVEPDAGYKLDKLTVNGRDITGTAFTMPAEKATVSATFEKVEEYAITYESAQHGKISGVDKAAADADVSVNVEPDDGYKLDKLTVNGEAVTGTTFKMPAGQATVSATFVVKPPQQGCYIATSVYGSYDAPEVWTLRRFRDDVLGQTWYGRLFIKAYYATSPTLVRLFGDAEWFRDFWREKLDGLVQNLQDDGFESTPYQDKDW